MEHGWKAERSHFRMRNAFGLFCYSTSLHMRVTECNFPWGWTESSYLSGTDQNRSFGRKTGVQWKLCQPPSPCFKGNSAKLSRFGTPTSVYFTLVPIWCIRPPKCSCFVLFFCHNWPSEIYFSAVIHNEAAYSFTSLSPLPSVVWPQVFNWLRVELLTSATSPQTVLINNGFFSGYISVFSSETWKISPCPKLRLMPGNECAVY